MKNKITEKSEIKRWWDYKRQLRWKNIYNRKDYSSLTLNNRMQKILYNINKLGLKKIKILEIGFGGGQLAYELIKRGNQFEGIDVSTKLKNVATDRCKNLRNKKFSFKVASIENALRYKESTFDMVIVAGVLQYALKPNFVFKEIHRVLKKEGIFICAQTNFYKLHYFFYLRSLLIRFYYMFSNDKLEISNSFRSLLLETKLKNLLSKKQKIKLKKSIFFNKNYTKVNFKFKKRIFYRKKILKLARYNNFEILHKDACGPYLNIGYKKDFFWLLNYVLEFLANIPLINILKNFGESQILVFKK